MEIKYFKVCGLDKTPICDLADNTEFRVSNVNVEYSINEVTTLTFDLPVKSPKFQYIQCENLIYFDDEYYFIKTPDFRRDDGGKLYVHVECKHLSDILASQLISIEEITPLTVVELMKIALQYDENGEPTLGWKVGKVKVDRVACRGLEANESSPFSILLTIAEKYSGVLVFDSKTMEVNMYPTDDQDHPKLDLRVSKNLKDISVKYDTSEMVTRMYGYGYTDEKTDVELDFMSVSPDSMPYIENYNYFVARGYSLEYIKENPALFVRTNIFRDDNIVDAQDLYDTTLDELAKASKPTINVEITGLDMSMAKGIVRNNTMYLNNNPYSLKVGDCVRVADDDINADFICNVTKRSIDYENPHILTVSLTNNVEYKDVLSELYGNVSNMSTVVSSGGKLHGGKIDNINVSQIGDIAEYYITAAQIEAKYATIENLRAEYITAETIRATYLDAQSIAAKYATISSLNAIEAKIEKLNVDEINAKLANLDQVIADNATIKKLVATDAEIKDLQAQDVTIAGLLKSANAEIDSLKSTSVTAGEFNAYKGTIEKLFATYASIEYLEANYINANTIETNYAKITELDAVKGNFDTLKTNLAEVEKLVADKADIKDLNAVTANIDTINANLANVEKLVAKKVDADYVQAEIVKANKVITDQLDSINATIENLDTKYATIDQLNAAKANLEELISKKATIEELNAAKASIGELDAQLANINSIMAGNIGTGLLQTIHLTASNVVMDDAIIKSANIKDLDVSKLNAGTISTDKFTIKSDDGGIQIVGSTQQFTDKNGKVRLQVGKDAQGNFNFIVFGEDGSTAIYDQNGITKKAVPDGLIVDQMVADDAGIKASKVKYIDEDGDKTLQTVVESQQGKITSLIKETEIIKDDFNNLQIGGRNLFLNSGDLSKVHWGATQSGTYTIGYETDNDVPSKNVRKMTWSVAPTMGIYFTAANYYNAGIKKGDIVTVSVWCKCSANKNVGKLLCEFLNVTSSTIPNLSTSWQKYVVTGVVNKDVVQGNGALTICFYYGSNINVGDSLYISSPKVEFGNKATDWTPAPEDLENVVTTLSDKYNETVKTVEGNTTTIANVKTSVDTVTGDVNSMKSSITEIKETADGVSTTVSQNKSKWNNASTDATKALNHINSLKVDNLILNGDGSLKNNTNHASWTFKGDIVYENVPSFQRYGAASILRVHDDSIPIDVSKEYEFSMNIKSLESNNLLYLGFREYDIDRNHIKAEYQYAFASSTTTLAKDLKDGDTIVYLTSTSGFNSATTLTHQLGLIFWNYKDSTGYQYPVGVYSRYAWLDLYTNSNIDKTNNTITLKTAWSHGTFEAGTSVSQTNSGGYKYFVYYGNVLPTTWTKVSNKIKKTQSLYDYSSTAFNPAAKYIDFTMLTNYGSSTKRTTLINNVKFRDCTLDNSISAVKTVADQTADKFTWLVKSGTSSTNFTLTDRTADLISNQINLRGLVKFSGLTASTQRALNNGKCLYPDETFLTGTNSVIRYGNGIDTTTYPNANVVTRIDKISDCPTSSPYCLKISLGNGAFTGLSGFIQRIDSRANAVFVQKFVAKLPIGYQFYRNSNSMGTGYVDEFITDVIGTGKFTEYIRVTRCGSSGEFYGGGHVYVKPISSSTTAPTDANPVVFYLASCTTYDVTEVTDSNVWGLDEIPDTNVTLINGGMIKTKSITTSQLNVDEILAVNGTFLNTINAQEINADRITSGTIRANLINAYGLSILDKTSNIETFSVANDGQVMLRGSVESYDYVTGKTGWSINRKGSAEFNDVTVRGSLITNDGGIVSSGGIGINLQKNTSFYDGLNDWEYPQGMWVVDSTFKYNGVNTAKFVRSGLMNSNPVNIRTKNGAIPASQGETFTAQAMFYTEDYGSQFSSDNVSLRIIFRNSSNSSLSEVLKKPTWTNKQWIKCEVTGTAPSGTTNVLFVVQTATNGVYWMAQPKIERGDTSTPWSLSIGDKAQTPRFWAGTTYENREFAPFIVYNDGSMKATRGTFGGVFTGDIRIGNISIVDPNSSAGNDAILTITNGNNGINAVQLTDTSRSTFAQNIVVTDDFYNEQVKINQNGSVNAARQVIVGDVNNESSERTILSNNYLQFNGGTINSSDKALVINKATNVDIGTVSNTTDLTVYGDTNARGILKVFKEISFNDMVKCTVSESGIDFNYYEGAETKLCTITYDTQGGSSVASSTVAVGGVIPTVPNPTYSDGATFMGWYKDKRCTQPWSSDYPVEGDMTLYAKWAEPTKPEILANDTNYYSTSTIFYNGNEEVGADWTIGFTNYSGRIVSYRWYADLYIQYNGADENGNPLPLELEKENILPNETTSVLSGEKLFEIAKGDNHYVIKGSCIVTLKLGNTTSNYVYSGFSASCYSHYEG